MWSRWCASLAAALAVIVVCSRARADAVPSPPTDCPSGARGQTSHNGTWCEPTTCQTDADCEKSATFWDRDIKKVCREQALCIETRTEPSRSGWSMGAPITRQIAHSVCSAETTCAPPSTCQSVKRCVVPPPPPPKSLFGCSFQPPAPLSAFPALSILLAAAALHRRRRSGG